MAPSLNPQTRIARREDLIVESLSGETVMLDPEGDRYLRLNSAGGMLWAALAEPKTIAELGAKLEDWAGIGADRAAGDATAFARALLEAGAARIEPGRP